MNAKRHIRTPEEIAVAAKEAKQEFLKLFYKPYRIGKLAECVENIQAAALAAE